MMKIQKMLGMGDKTFYKQLKSVSLPIMFQQLLATAMYMIDTMMVGGLGDPQLAGLGVANQVTFVIDLCLIGIMSGGGVFMAQYWGKRDSDGVKKSMGMCLLLGLGIALLSVILVQTCGTWLLGLFSPDSVVVGYGNDYLRIASFSYILRAIIYPYGRVHKSCGNASLPLYGSILALVINVILNYGLIYGNLGMPNLGVEGAAIATVIGMSAETFLLLFFSYKKENPARATLKHIFGQTRQSFKRNLSITIPIMLNDVIWALGTSAYILIYGHISTDALAAMTIFFTMEKLAFVTMVGLGTACGVNLGNTIGEGNLANTKVYAKRYIFIAALLGAAMGILLFILSWIVPGFYNVTDNVKQMSAEVIRVLSCFTWLQSVNYVIIIGILRCGGDTTAASIIDIGPLYVCTLPLLALTGLYFEIPLYLVYLCVMPAEVIRLFAGVKRMRQNKWMRDVTL